MPGTALIYPFQPIDVLEYSLIDSWQAVSRATHRFFHLLREFDLAPKGGKHTATPTARSGWIGAAGSAATRLRKRCTLRGPCGRCQRSMQPLSRVRSRTRK